MTAGTGLQWATMVAFGLLLVMCVWTGRNHRLRPFALALGLWAGNGLAFYVALLLVFDAVIGPTMVAWSALTRLQGILLGMVSLMVLEMQQRERN